MTKPLQIGPNGRINPASISGETFQTRNSAHDEARFADALKKAEISQRIKFSNHAQKRLQTRDIRMTEDGLARLANAIDKAGKRGGRESLVLMDDLAFIVNVKDRLVVTALNAHKRGEGVFTQIDSVVLADKPVNQTREA